MSLRTWRHALTKAFDKLRKHPIRVLALGFAAVILIGSLLLWLPLSVTYPIRFSEAVFTATSALCANGLAVVDTGARFTVFGQALILMLIQLGGLCFMGMGMLVMLILGRRLAPRDRQALQLSIGEAGMTGLARPVRWLLGMTFGIELFGAALLATRMIPRFGLGKGVFYSIFHSVSAFCNAGFDLMGNYTNMTAFRNDPWTLLIIMLLVIVGGLGYYVIYDLTKNAGKRGLSLHTKVVLSVSGVLIAAGAVFFLIIEWANPETLAHPGLMPWIRPVVALFQSVSLRTAGFQAMEQAAMTDASKLMSILLMLVGASPASTGGGMKTTTVFMLYLLIVSTVQGRENVTAFGRQLHRGLVQRALVLMLAFMGVTLVGTMAITLIEFGFVRRGIEMDFLELAFEVVSALCAVGNTCDLTLRLSTPSRMLLMILMLIGRLGPMSLLITLSRRQRKGGKSAPLPEGHLMIG